MKYKAIYSVLEKRGREVPGFRYDDRSCWRFARLTYIDRLHSLWIIAVDPATGRLFWITHDGGNDFCISFRNMDLAEKLQKLFSEPDVYES